MVAKRKTNEVILRQDLKRRSFVFPNRYTCIDDIQMEDDPIEHVILAEEDDGARSAKAKILLHSLYPASEIGNSFRRLGI